MGKRVSDVIGTWVKRDCDVIEALVKRVSNVIGAWVKRDRDVIGAWIRRVSDVIGINNLAKYIMLL